MATSEDVTKQHRMGNRSSVFSEGELQSYEELTYLNRSEILYAYQKWAELDTTPDARHAQVPIETVARQIKSLKENPFAVQICAVFCSSDDGRMGFEDFLDLVSVFNYKCKIAVKICWAFKIFDMNGDGYICRDDVNSVLQRLTKNRISPDAALKIADKVMENWDFTGSGLLSYNHFERSLFDSDEFARNFSFHLS